MKILYVTTISGTMSFFLDHFKMLIAEGNEIELACNLDTPLKHSIQELNLMCYDIPFSRSPLSRNNIKAYKQLKKLIKNKKYDVIHCHTPNAAAITRVACKGLRNKGLKVVYTAHGFHFYKGSPQKNWILYYPVEWICSFWTDVLITINQEDYRLARNKLHAISTQYIEGVGINLQKFKNTTIDVLKKREQLNIPHNAFVLLSVGELNSNKNHQIVIKALAHLENSNVYYIIAGEGNEREKLENLIKELKLENRVMLLGYRNDIKDLCKSADAYILPSIREGLNVSIMEAMASGLPILCSNIRGNVDLVDNNGGIIFDNSDEMDVCRCLQTMLRLNNNQLENMRQYNMNKIRQFGIENVLNKLRQIYK